MSKPTYFETKILRPEHLMSHGDSLLPSWTRTRMLSMPLLVPNPGITCQPPGETTRSSIRRQETCIPRQ